MNKYIDMLQKDGKQFIIEEKRNSVTIIGKGGKVKAVIDKENSISKIKKSNSSLSKGSLLSIFATVKKSFITALSKNLEIERLPQFHPSTFTNRDTWNDLRKGRVFYYIDVNHCYWRIAYLQGYISEYYYNKILENPEYKLYRNMALASIKAPKTRKYYNNGELQLTVTEDTRILDTAYANIRYTAWNLMGAIKTEVGQDCLKYITDGIMVFKKDVDYVCDCLDNADLTYSIVKCKKLNKKEIETIDLITGEVEISKF